MRLHSEIRIKKNKLIKVFKDFSVEPERQTDQAIFKFFIFKQTQ